jgi:hypothetical protein
MRGGRRWSGGKLIKGGSRRRLQFQRWRHASDGRSWTRGKQGRSGARRVLENEEERGERKGHAASVMSSISAVGGGGKWGGGSA